MSEKLTLSDLFPDAGIARAAPVAGISADSRQIRAGFVFAALQGVQGHGRDFIAQAKAAGAIAVLHGGDVEDSQGLVSIAAAQPRLALSRAASLLFPRQPPMIVAVTGTNGKSSTVDFLRQIWAFAGHRAASLGTLGVIGPHGARALQHTTPDPVQIHAELNLLAQEQVSHVALEASSHGLDQYRLDHVRLAAAAFTNLTQDHLDYHQTMDAYRAAKTRLFSELLPQGGLAVVNADDPARDFFIGAAQARAARVLTCGWRGRDLKIDELSPKPAAQVLDLLWAGRSFRVRLPLMGEFQALNALTAAGLALGLGEAPESVFAALEGLKGVKGRIEWVGATADGAPVFVDYAHTPDGLDALLRAARPHTRDRLVCVFGCGGDRDASKRPKMGAIAEKHADVVIVTDDNPRSEDPGAIRAAVLEGCPGALEIGDRAEAIRAAIAMLRAGDVLVIAGKGHETGQIIGGVVHPFSDQDQARAALATKKARP